MTERNDNNKGLDSGAVLAAVGAAWLLIDRDGGRLDALSDAAAELLGVEAAGVTGRHWQELLGGPQGADPALTRSVDAGLRCTLPPVLVQSPTGEEFVAGGLVLPAHLPSSEQTLLSLHRLDQGLDRALLAGLGGADTIAVLGVEQPLNGTREGGAEAVRRMMDIRSSLIDIVRAGDSVGLPVGSAITLVLRDTDSGGAQDISRALLSHLRSTPQSPGIDRSDLRLRIGLAQVGTGPADSPLRALLAANRAMDRAWYGIDREAIRVADEDDAAFAGSRAVAAGGIFSDDPPAAGLREFLEELQRLVASAAGVEGDALPQAVADLLLEQPGVLGVAIYQRRRDNLFECVAGAASGALPGEPLEEEQLPRVFRDSRRRIDRDQLERIELVSRGGNGLDVLPLRAADQVLGYVALQREAAGAAGAFTPDAAAMHVLSTGLAALRGWRENPATSVRRPAPQVTPMETGLDGYVGDNMEGAVDQAMFLARLDVPIAIIGPRGTGKLYVAKIIHKEWGGEPDMLVEIDCREFHSRKRADARIAAELRQAEGKSLVFKSAHLMNADAQARLARQISSRTLADVSPPEYLPRVKLIALFPDNLDKLVRWDGLSPQLASVFSGYPIHVPPIKDRRQAVLRWAHKILGQECEFRERYVRGFTPDAEQAMLQHDWPGNISEMRRCIVDALDKTDKEWISPVDLGIYKGIGPDRTPHKPETRPFLSMVEEVEAEDASYTPSALEALDVALGEAVNTLLARNSIQPLGSWLEDEVVLAVCERYGNDMRGAADFLHTRPRNISRWLPKIQSREAQRAGSSLWQESRSLVRDWIMEAGQMAEPPLQLIGGVLLGHVLEQGGDLSVAARAKIMGVSVPTYQKRLQENTAP